MNIRRNDFLQKILIMFIFSVPQNVDGMVWSPRDARSVQGGRSTDIQAYLQNGGVS